MRTRYKIFDNQAVYFITSSIIDWYEIFESETYFNILLDVLKFKKNSSELKLFAYVFMKNHFHMILSSNNIVKFIKEYKSYTAREVLRTLNSENKIEILDYFNQKKKSYKNKSSFQIWQEGYHPELISNIDIFKQKAEYIHNNPIRKEYVTKPEDWKYFSASNYILGYGIIDIDLLV